MIDFVERAFEQRRHRQCRHSPLGSSSHFPRQIHTTWCQPLSRRGHVFVPSWAKAYLACGGLSLESWPDVRRPEGVHHSQDSSAWLVSGYHFCVKKYHLPTQDEAIAATVAKAVDEGESCRKAGKWFLLMLGDYTIGKERIYLAVAESLGVKVYVDKTH